MVRDICGLHNTARHSQGKASLSAVELGFCCYFSGKFPRDSGDPSFELGLNFGPELNKLRLECRKLSGETQQWEKPDRCRDSVAVLSFCNNLGDGGDCQNTWKSYKTSQFVG
jgi:hypothetical protein